MRRCAGLVGGASVDRVADRVARALRDSSCAGGRSAATGPRCVHPSRGAGRGEASAQCRDRPGTRSGIRCAVGGRRTLDVRTLRPGQRGPPDASRRAVWRPAPSFTGGPEGRPGSLRRLRCVGSLRPPSGQVVSVLGHDLGGGAPYKRNNSWGPTTSTHGAVAGGCSGRP